MQALTTPLARSFALGGLLLALGVGAAVLKPTSCCDKSTHKLVLHAPVEADAFYLTAWSDGPLHLKFDLDEMPGFEITSEAWYYGCKWRGVETLVPIDTRTYSYDYRETLLGCRAGATPTRKTPRQGYVTVE
ncbi:MAG: hypothetical protein KF773_02115 [Deltaproteobacteria bacterium]|nr:hypothetical protein [Deltaproteobacteria bacterium]MCW5807677.1 hypothetical protein [Deltaproteobacteria bacterium]